MARRLLTLAAILVAVFTSALVGTTPALSAGNTWTGATSTDWANGSNWSTGVVPGVADDVTLPSSGVFANPVISTDVRIRSLTVQAGRSLTINDGRSLTLSGSSNGASVLTNAGTITGPGALRVEAVAGSYYHSVDQGGVFSARLVIAAGVVLLVHGANNFDGAVNVDSGATLKVHEFRSLLVKGDFTVNGTVQNNGAGTTVSLSGSTLVNNGLVTGSAVTLSRSGAQTVVGDGNWSPPSLTISGGSTVMWANAATVGGGSFAVNSGASLSVSNPLTLTATTVTNSGIINLSDTFTLLNNTGSNASFSTTGTVSGSGTFRVMASSAGGTYTDLAQSGATFSAPLRIGRGVARDEGGSYQGPIHVDNGATLV